MFPDIILNILGLIQYSSSITRSILKYGCSRFWSSPSFARYLGDYAGLPGELTGVCLVLEPLSWRFHHSHARSALELQPGPQPTVVTRTQFLKDVQICLYGVRLSSQAYLSPQDIRLTRFELWSVFMNNHSLELGTYFGNNGVLSPLPAFFKRGVFKLVYFGSRQAQRAILLRVSSNNRLYWERRFLRVCGNQKGMYFPLSIFFTFFMGPLASAVRPICSAWENVFRGSIVTICRLMVWYYQFKLQAYRTRTLGPEFRMDGQIRIDNLPCKSFITVLSCTKEQLHRGYQQRSQGTFVL